MTLLTETPQSLKKKIDRLLEEADASILDGMDEEEAARDVLVAQTTDVYRELAVAALVSMLRRRARTRTLERERASESRREQQREQEESDRLASPEWQEWKRKHDAEAEQAQREIKERMNATMRQAIETFAQSVRMEWTAELLASGFILSNGSKVTWGDATVEQHEDRLTTFTRLAVANAEGAARHQQAIEALRESGAPTLAAMVGTA